MGNSAITLYSCEATSRPRRSRRTLSHLGLAIAGVLMTFGCAGAPNFSANPSAASSTLAAIASVTAAAAEPGSESPAADRAHPSGTIAVSAIRYNPNTPPVDPHTLHGARPARPVAYATNVAHRANGVEP